MVESASLLRRYTGNCIEGSNPSLSAILEKNIIKASFNPNASITGYLPDGFHEMSVDDFAGFVASQQPSPMENNDEKMLEILSCEVYGNTAAVKVREAYLGMIFIDCLSFLKKDDEWKIYTKLFHVES